MTLAPVYGRNGRIGLIVPANNSVIEPELWSMLPPQVAIYSTRLRAKGDLTPAAVRAMEGDVAEAVAAIASTNVDVIAYCDMVTTFIMETGWNERAVERIRTATGIPAMSAWTAMRDALAQINARRIAIGTPYPQGIHALAAPFFAERGFTVVSDATLDILAMREVPTVGRSRLEGLIRCLDLRGCDALVLLATDLPTFECLNDLEHELGLAILGSNQTLLWRALKFLGLVTSRPLGRLSRS